MRFYGNNEETYAVETHGKTVCVQSPDLLARDGRFMIVAALPENASELNSVDVFELGLCVSCFEVDIVSQAIGYPADHLCTECGNDVGSRNAEQEQVRANAYDERGIRK